MITSFFLLQLLSAHFLVLILEIWQQSKAHFFIAVGKVLNGSFTYVLIFGCWLKTFKVERVFFFWAFQPSQKLESLYPFNAWFISIWEENKCCCKLSMCTKWQLFHSKLSKLSFWVKIIVILSVTQLVTTVFFFSAWDKLRVKWDNSRNSTQKLRTKEWNDHKKANQTTRGCSFRYFFNQL